jgi:tetrahydromethanopterin S-methyltransferase subunit A
VSTGAESESAVAEATAQLRDAVAAEKCWRCACLRDAVSAIERAYPGAERPEEIGAVLRAARERLRPAEYDCLGCAICFPALAVNALDSAADAPAIDLAPCSSADAAAREGWPPYPGSYTVLRYRAPVAICTLTSRPLAEEVVRRSGAELSVVGTLATENIGIERLVENVVANPHVRFLVVCGEDSEQALGHLPGQSLLALARDGVDERGRIVGARGRRPVLRNLGREAIEHFRGAVEVIDHVGSRDAAAVVESARECAARDPGPAEPFAGSRVVQPIPARVPERSTPDPSGYFIVFVDRVRRLLALEHYGTNGILDAIVEGAGAAEIAATAVERELLTRLDHAAYLGRELARAERALTTGEEYVQDAAPERRWTPSEAASPCECAQPDEGCGDDR